LSRLDKPWPLIYYLTMSTGRIKWLAIFFLCLYGAALVHQVVPHHHDEHHTATCGLCLLVFATVLAVAAVTLLFCARAEAVRVQTVVRSFYPVFFSSTRLRAPPNPDSHH